MFSLKTLSNCLFISYIIFYACVITLQLLLEMITVSVPSESSPQKAAVTLHGQQASLQVKRSSMGLPGCSVLHFVCFPEG